MKTTLRRTVLVTLVATTLFNSLVPSTALAFKGNAQIPSAGGTATRVSKLGGAQRYTPRARGGYNNNQYSTPNSNYSRSNTPEPNASRPEQLVGDWMGRANLRSGMMDIGIRLQADGVFRCRFVSQGEEGPSGFDGQWYVSGNELVFAPEDGGEPMVMPLQVDGPNQIRIRFVPTGPVVEMRRMNNSPGQGEQYTQRNQPAPRPTPGPTPQPRGYRQPYSNGPRQNANQIVGNWVGQANVQHVSLQTQCMFNADGTMHFQAIIHAAGQGTTNMQIAGKWRMEGNKIIIDSEQGVDELVLQNGALMLKIDNLGITIPLHRTN